MYSPSSPSAYATIHDTQKVIVGIRGDCLRQLPLLQAPSYKD